jgi:hypothetical protein
MPAQERRNLQPATPPARLRSGLTESQQATLDTLEQFRWTLGFVRRPMFGAPMPVVFHPDGKRFAVLEPDGTINEAPGIRLRN